jgi:hypothetical protein
LNDPCPPLSLTVALAGDSVNVHPCPWLSVKVLPATVTVALRPGPVVAAALYCTSPLPVPVAPDAIVSHDSLLDAVHEQPAVVATVTRPLPPAAGTDAESGEMENTHPADCVIVTRCPATVAVPVRVGPDVAATVNATVPFPLPDADPWRVIQGTSDDAVHGHPAFALTDTAIGPPPAPTECVDGETLYAHPGDCVTVKICPATTAVPVRAGPDVAGTENVTAPGPLPDGCPSEIHSTLLDADHGHAGVVVIAIEPEPPPGCTFCEVGEIV